jgi:exopolyphosphatase/guanosine-5'-triphosphate,3'-diphosphate pyrophosphatase
MREVDPDPAHALQVAKLADRFFLLLKPLHQAGGYERRLLAAAALLHDIGWSEAPDGKGHHKHSARLIRRHKWQSLSAVDIELAAQIARYHRRKWPSLKHAPFKNLEPPARRIVFAMASLLRMADALDRSHQAHVRDLMADLSGKSIQMTAFTRTPAREEEYAFLKKKDLFEDYFEVSIQLDIRRS